MERFNKTSLIIVAGYHDDQAALKSLRDEHISKVKTAFWFEFGQNAQTKGISCNCSHCAQLVRASL